MPSHPLTNFEIQKYYQNEPKFNGVYSRSNSPKIRDGAYVINLDEYRSIRAHWIALYINGKNVAYLDTLENDYIPKQIKKFRENKNVKTNIYITLAND